MTYKTEHGLGFEYLSVQLSLYGPKHYLTSSKAVLLAVPKQTKHK